MTDIINKLKNGQKLTYDEFLFLLNNRDDKLDDELKQIAVQKRKQRFGNEVFVRGLIEFSNYCKNNCFYCGIRCGNKNADRYRLTKEQILGCCEQGYQIGYRTFVLQGGEDMFFTPDKIADIVYAIKQNILIVP